MHWIEHWLAELEQEMEGIDPQAEAQDAAAKGPFGAEFYMPFLQQNKADRYLFGVTNILRMYPQLQRDRPAGPAWLGPMLLLAGIVFAAAASLLAFAAPS